VLRLRDEARSAQTWQPGDELIVEWRALTVALLDELARARCASCCTWTKIGCRWPACWKAAPGPPAARCAAPHRNGLPPLQVASDGNRLLRKKPVAKQQRPRHRPPPGAAQAHLMRNKEASTNSFRRLLNELGDADGLRGHARHADAGIEIETPLEKMTGKVIDGKKLVFVSILRAGTGILDGMLSVVPGARVGHIGLYRDPKTLTAVEYYFKMPQNMQSAT
jgi:hypothetical protein